MHVCQSAVGMLTASDYVHNTGMQKIQTFKTYLHRSSVLQVLRADAHYLSG
jgi:hypothetical protein